MATLKEKIIAKIKPCCRNMACAEQAADVAIKLVEEKFTSTNSASLPCPDFTRGSMTCLAGYPGCACGNGDPCQLSRQA